MKCVVCGRYAIDKELCPSCGGPLRVPHPARFSPEDRYGKYRRLLKMSTT
ncbi:MAG: RNA-protein complex protein Nop10 [Candidatus Nezhaarchaeota archaeon]|nr:RNA-protein complex protein Nop10 [Candidatus Nezhaarchaeota archaeon]